MSTSNSTLVFKLRRGQENNDSNAEGDEQDIHSQEDEDTKTLLSILCKHGKVGAACYNFQEKQLYVYEEFLDIFPRCLATIHLLREINPSFILSTGSIKDEFIRILRDIFTNRSDTTVTSDSVCSLPANFFLVSPKEYSYEICKSIISQIKLPSIEDDPSEVRRELTIHSLIDFDNRMSVQAAGTLVKYLEKNWTYFGMINDDLKCLSITQISRKHHLLIDNPTFEALQIFSKRGHDASFKRGLPSSTREGLSIYKLFSHNCKSKNGLISLRNILFNPTNDRNVLEKRQDFISFVLQPCNEEFIASLRDNMKGIGGDINMILSKIENSRANSRDWNVLYKAIYHTIFISDLCAPYKDQSCLLMDLSKAISQELLGLEQSIENGIDFTVSQKRGRPIIRFGLDEVLDAKKLRQQDIAKDITAAARFAANNLPEFLDECAVIYLPEMGHLIGVKEWSQGCAPEDLEHLGFNFMFTIGGTIHYKNPMCFELDKRLGDINAEIIDHENRILRRLSGFILKYNKDIREPIKIIGLMDCLISMALTASQNMYIRPTLNQQNYFEIQNSRHPLMEHLIGQIQSNNFYSGGKYSRMKIITGPNGSGKSMYLKQIALVMFLAHVGSFVPAEAANIGMLKSIHSRLQTTESASVRLSAFMIDISQMTSALNNIQPCSLILMDEFGKGTTEVDGVCLLAGLLRYFLDRMDGCPHILVATHFQQIVSHLPKTPLILYQKMEHRKETGGLCFLFRLVEGISESFAIDVAEACGIDIHIIRRAREIMESLQHGKILRPLEHNRRNNFNPDNLHQLNIPEPDE
ncbi:unnamed protein product [Phaedon cochleariae]|uniref:DNA mismatch repair proteins mutS family domain-containing protein n=1 Tax=Phaedon cochleariae TaxID=80249 RepID=A0A9P0DF63_PHACE|nr:unnamed protein product [Phaedon cochleariae]